MIIEKIKNYLFVPRFHFNRFQFNLVALFFITVGLVSGSYLTLKKVFPNIFAADGSPGVITISNSDNFGYNPNDVSIGSSGVQLVNKFNNPYFDVGTSSWNVSAVGNTAITPAGWVVAPGNLDFGTSDFLVMKYEAKALDTGDTTGGLNGTVLEDGGILQLDEGEWSLKSSWAGDVGQTRYQAVSRADGLPWGGISQDDDDFYVDENTTNKFDAKEACLTADISGIGISTHLISDKEWMTIARNVEAQDSNWSLGKVGSGYIYAGHNDSFLATPLKASSDDANRAAYTDDIGMNESLSTATNTATGSAGMTGGQVRTLNLSNGSVVWDMSGNVAEWTSDVVEETICDGVDGTSNNALLTFVEWSVAETDNQGVRAKYSSNNSYSSDQGIGAISAGNEFFKHMGSGFVRGGLFIMGKDAGIYSLLTALPPNFDDAGEAIGFRCASDAITGLSQSVSADIGRSGAGNQVSIGSSIVDGLIYQNINVGDTSNYDFSVYVYDEGSSEVNAETASLFYNGSKVETNYSIPDENGWCKLSGTIVGSVTDKQIGVLVKSGKTVKVDDFSLIKQGTFFYTKIGYIDPQVINWTSFDASLGDNSEVKFQFCIDDGFVCEANIGTTNTTWQYYDVGTSDWTNATNLTTHTNTKDQLTVEEAMKKLLTTNEKISVKAIIIHGSSEIPVVNSFTIGVEIDNDPPGNISTISMKKNFSAGSTMMANDWTNDSGPYFEWDEATDDNGIKGYCLYLSNGDYDPSLETGIGTSVSPLLPGNSNLDSIHISSENTECGGGNGFMVGTTSVDFSTEKYRGSSWLTTSSDPYYLYVRPVDSVGNINKDDEIKSFVFRFDNTPPTNPLNISLPQDYIATKSATFLWPSSGVDGPKDENQSGLLGLQYRIGIGGTWYGSSHTGSQGMDDLLENNGNYTTSKDFDFILLNEGSNLIYLRTWDVAGNVTTSYVSNALKVNTQSPSKPTNLVVNPIENLTSNSYSFTWNDPINITGQASKLTFCYTVNTKPTATTCSFTSAGVHSLAADAFATQPGSNTFYLVARDEAGNINYESYESVSFTYSGSAPGIPTGVRIIDNSNKAGAEWNLLVSWDAPSNIGAGVKNYKVYRSDINVDCSTNISSFEEPFSTGLQKTFYNALIDQKTYYYCVKACDSAENCSAASETKSKYPTGSYITAANLTSGPTVGSITTKKAVISWSTSRSSDSKVSYGLSSNSYFDDQIGNDNQTSSHSVNLTNLKAGTTYYYKTKWTDEDGNIGTSEEKTFTTAAAPTVKDVAAKEVGLSSAIINFTTKDASKVRVYYGTSTTFGGVKELSISSEEMSHIIELNGLLDGTKYYYKINTFDSDNSEYEGTTLDFSTLPRPKISAVRLEQVANTAQTTIRVSWNTNTEVSSVITYYPENDTGAIRDDVKVALEKGSHVMVIRGLLPETNYILTVKGRDKLGNEAVSDSQRFTTATDTRPPMILNLKLITGTIPPVGFVAGEITSQIIVSWDTDEPSTSQVEFGQGAGTSYSQKTQEDGSLTTNHTVIISNLTPSQVYHLRVVSKDKVGNETAGIDNVIIASKATKSALDLVVKNLSEAFGFFSFLSQ